MYTLTQSRSRTLAAMTWLLALASACSPKPAPTPATTTTPTAATPPTPPASATPAPTTPAPPAAPKKIIYLSFSDDVKSSDPAQANDVLSSELIGHIFEGLLQFSYLNTIGTVEPKLAEALPLVTEKGKLLKFRLRKNAFFHDDPAFPEGKGRQVTANDFVYSVKRLADPRNTSPNWWMFDDIIVGLNDWRKAIENAPPDAQTDTQTDARDKLFENPIAGLTSDKPFELTIRLTKVFPQFLQVLSMPPASLVAREVIEKYPDSLMNHPIGSGPFRLKEWIHGSKIIVEKNPSYRADIYPTVGSDEIRQAGLLMAAGQKMPFVDEIHWDIIKEEQPRWLKFLNGDLDETGIPKDNFAQVIDATGNLRDTFASQNVKLHKAMSLTSWWIEFNLKDPLLGRNPKLRQALALAFDRTRALDLLYNNRGILARGPLPPNMEGAALLPPYPWEHDLKKAKKLLSEAGYPGGRKLPTLTFDLRGPGTTPRQLGELLSSGFAKIGVKLNILANSFPEALEKARQGKFQIMLGGWAADYPDPENFLQLFYSGNAAPGPNSSNFINKEYDALYQSMRSASPSTERAKTIVKMIAILNREAPVAFFFHSMDYKVSRPWLKNYKPHPLVNTIGLFMDVDLAQKAEAHKQL